MANEPERPIEKLLRAAAKKRCDEAGAPLELHPATRRLLQGEVTRTFAQARRERPSRARLLGQLWPRFAWGLALLAVLVVTVWLLPTGSRRDEPPTRLAQSEPASRAMRAAAPLQRPPAGAATASAPSPAAAEQNSPAFAMADTVQPPHYDSADQRGLMQKQLAKDRSAARVPSQNREQLPQADAFKPSKGRASAQAEIASSGGARARGPAPSGGFALEERQTSGSRQALPGKEMLALPSQAPATMPPAAAPAVAVDESPKLKRSEAGQLALSYTSPAGVSAVNNVGSTSAETGRFSNSAALALRDAGTDKAAQRFARVPLASKAYADREDKAAPAQPVLASFQVEQAGSELRIVDDDGSVYSGFVQLANTTRRALEPKSEPRAAAAPTRVPEGAVENKALAGLDSARPEPQNYFFRVTGTNRTLQKKVVFSGNLFAAKSRESLPAVTNALSVGTRLDGYAAGSPQPALLPLPQARISGKVVVGSGKAVEINALPTSP